jgi:hypothetical protein
MSAERPPIPTRRTSSQPWRRACLAYREMRRAGASDHEAHEAAVAVLQEVWPLQPAWKPSMPSPTRPAIIILIEHRARATLALNAWSACP